MKNINLFIDDTPVTVPEGTTIMQAAETIGVHIPRLCYVPKLSLEGACRICIVEAEGYKGYLASCAAKVAEGMKVRTNSPEIRQARRDLVELILDNHPMECQTCERDGQCELQNLAYTLGVRERLFEGKRKQFEIDDSGFSVVRNSEKCILCRRCIRVCSEVQGVYNLNQMYRGVNTVVGPAFMDPMRDSVCINCGQCINICPTAAFIEQDSTEDVWAALADPKKTVIVQVAPAIRAAIGEGFGMPVGTPAAGKTVTALRRLGFQVVFDANFSADLTIMEEANEFIHRLQSGGKLPLITSCSPGWIKFMELFYPEFIPYASTCKSPMSMLSTLIKTYYAKTKGLDPKDIYVVAVMPCTAKKFEAKRPEHTAPEGYPYTDAVLTTRELVWMIKSYGIDFTNLEDSDFDSPLGVSSGAADIFGTTGGVMEAALRTAYEKITGETLKEVNFYQVRDAQGLKEASLKIGKQTVNVAVANGLQNARTILDSIKNGEKQYHLVEIMACPGGCIGGGGQPYPQNGHHVFDPELLKLRASALYSIDEAKTLRKSHENPDIQKLYDEYLKQPGSELAHKLLHTRYTHRFPRGI